MARTPIPIIINRKVSIPLRQPKNDADVLFTLLENLSAETERPGALLCTNSGARMPRLHAAFTKLLTGARVRASLRSDPVPVRAEEGVRYTVPAGISPERMEEMLKVRFRVGKVFQNCYISVYLNGDRILHRKKRILAPGEMEEVQLERQRLLEYQGLKAITVRIEEE